LQLCPVNDNNNQHIHHHHPHQLKSQTQDLGAASAWLAKEKNQALKNVTQDHKTHMKQLL
jgi:hypothetical protein